MIVCEENLSRILDKTFLSVTSGPSSALLESSSSEELHNTKYRMWNKKKYENIKSLKKSIFYNWKMFKTISKNN